MTEEALFRAAMERPDPAARRQFLDDACAGDPALRQRLDARLVAAAVPQGEETLTALPDSPATSDYRTMAEPGTIVDGRFKLLERLGEGGMGEVWVAKQTEPVQRMVALKLIKAGMDSKSVLNRFNAERQALALMDHPSIAKVLDGGLTPEGRPFFVMELVNGQPLTRFCDEAKLTTRERLELFVPVCHAVQHAHQKGIVHRDLKPTNILVTLYDGKPVPKVIDFGVAKATGGRLTEETLSTQFGSVVGTFEYMAPEQAGFSALDVDTRADVYSLGVILYELLTGLRPFDGPRLRKAAFDELFRILREEEPPRPSTKLSTDASLPSAAAARRTDPKKLAALMRGELDWIVMKALEKDRNRRYETAAGLARDVERYLRDEPVEARPPSARYRAQKFVRRNRGRVVAAGLVFLALVAGVIGTTVGLIEARGQRDAARRAEQQADADRREAEAERQRAVAEFQRAEQEGARARAAEIEQGKARTQAEAALLRSDGLRLASEAATVRSTNPGLALLLGLEGVRRYPHHLTFAALYDAAADLRERRDIPAGVSGLKGMRLSRDGARALVFAETGSENMACVIDLATGNRLATWRGYGFGASDTDWSADGKRAVSVIPGRTTVAFTDGKKPERATFTERVAYVWDTTTGRDLIHLRRHDDKVVSARFSPDGKKIVTASWDHTARIWDVATGKELHVLRGHTCALLSAVFSPDGQSVLTVSSQQNQSSQDRAAPGQMMPDREPSTDPGMTTRPYRVESSSSGGGSFGPPRRGDRPIARLWDVASGKQIGAFEFKAGQTQFEFDQPRPFAAAISPDGKRVAIGFDHDLIGVWDARGGEERAVFSGHRGRATALAFDPDGTLLATAGDGSTVFLWDLATGQPLRRFEGHTGSVHVVRFSGDGRRLVTAGTDRTARVWQVSTGKELGVFRGHTGELTAAEILPDGVTVLTAGDSTLRLWSVSTASPVPVLAYEPDPPSGRLARVLGSGPARHTAAVTALVFAPDGKTVYTGSLDRSVRCWDAATGRQSAEVAANLRGEVRSLRVGPGGELFVATDLSFLIDVQTSGDRDTVLSMVHRWDPVERKASQFLRGQRTSVSYIDLSKDGRRMVVVRRTTELRLSKGGSASFQWTDDHNRQGEATVWDVESGEQLCVLPPVGNYQDTPRPRFSPDGSTILYGTERWDGLALYDARTGKLLRNLAVPKDGWNSQWVEAAFSPDGRVIVGQRNSDRDLWFWDSGTGSMLGSFRSPVNPGSWTILGQIGFSPDSRRVIVAHDRVVQVVDVATRVAMQTLRGHEAAVSALAFSPDGTRILTGSDDKTAALWDAESGRLLAVYRGHAGAVNLVAYSPDGTRVATASAAEHLARVWPVDVVPAFDGRKPRELTAEERVRYELPPAK